MTGNEIKRIYDGVSMMNFKQEYRDAMDKALEEYEKFKSKMNKASDDLLLSFAYWLFRYSGLVYPMQALEAHFEAERQNDVMHETRIDRLVKAGKEYAAKIEQLEKELERYKQEAEKIQKACKWIQENGYCNIHCGITICPNYPKENK